MDNGELTYEIVEKAIDKMKIANEKPNTNGSVIIEFDILKHLVDTIDSQKAEIEILKNIGDNKTKELLRYDGFIRELHDKLKAAKAETIKEVAAEFYNSFAQYETYDRLHTFEILDRINSVEEFLLNNLVKEKVGDNDETKR